MPAAAAIAMEAALRELLREVVRDEVRAVLREELQAVMCGTARGASQAAAYLTTEDAAAIARVEPATVREWVRRGDLRRHQAGRELRVRRDELEAFLTTGRRSDDEHNVEALAVKILGKSSR